MTRLPTLTRPTEQPVSARSGLRWYREIGLILTFYGLYTLARNQFGSASVPPEEAFANALGVIDFERRIGLFFEHGLQQAFVGNRWLIRALNIFYGTFHFYVTAGTMAWLFRRFPEQYRRWRNAFVITTGSAIVGFSTFPLMPPRLLGDFGTFGGSSLEFQFVDTLHTVGGLWSFNSEAMQTISNQYAAMPSLHLAWATWCALVVVPRARRRWVKSLFATYPLVTLFAVVVTGNHYWIDGAVGVALLGAAWLVAGFVPAWTARLRTVLAQLLRPAALGAPHRAA